MELRSMSKEIFCGWPPAYSIEPSKLLNLPLWSRVTFAPTNSILLRSLITRLTVPDGAVSAEATVAEVSDTSAAGF
jgi:hypothetical protein